VIFTLIIVVLIHVHVSSSRLVMLGPLLLWCLRHAGQWWLGSIHGRQRRWVVGSLRRMVAIVEAARIRSILRAVTRNLRRRDPMRGWRRSATVWLFQLLTLLVTRLCEVIGLFPLSQSLGWGGRGTILGAIFALSGCCFCGCKGRGRSWSTARNTTAG
jgi:hypothetical protein